MNMPCRNTAALEAHEAAEYIGDSVIESYGQEARENCVNRILETRTDDVIELLTDDLCSALEDDESAWTEAVRDGDVDRMGLVMYRATRRIANDLVTLDEISAEAFRLAGD